MCAVGFGEISQQKSVNFCVYIANRPPMLPYDEYDAQHPMHTGEIASIAQHTGNHWRKVFNVYAKLMFEFCQQTQHKHGPWFAQQTGLMAALEHTSWQEYRDALLLQVNSQTSLLFSKPNTTQDRTIHIIMGKGYAEELGYPCEAPYLVKNEHSDFAYYHKDNVIVCPYFDYRQLSNAKISVLVELMQNLICKNAIGEP